MTKLIKYPRTYHFPWSPGLQNDDRRMPCVPFDGKRVIVTEKMDGENTSMYWNHIHARSRDSINHPSRTWVKAFWGTFRFDLPMRMRVCGENMFAKHSIHYTNLRSYFLGFSIWERKICLDWKTTLEWFDLLGIVPVPILYDGIYNRDVLDDIWSKMNPENNEGYVVRLASAFHINDFAVSVGKYVRKGHVQTDDFWMTQPVVPNLLRNT